MQQCTIYVYGFQLSNDNSEKLLLVPVHENFEHFTPTYTVLQRLGKSFSLASGCPRLATLYLSVHTTHLLLEDSPFGCSGKCAWTLPPVSCQQHRGFYMAVGSN